MDAVLSACHPLAPVISVAVRTLSAACVDGWVPANNLTPGVVLHATGTLAGLLRLTPAKVGAVLAAMDATGLLATGPDGARRMADHEAVIDGVVSSGVLSYQRSAKRKSRANKINKIDAKCQGQSMTCHDMSKTCPGQSWTHGDTVAEPTGHDAPAGSTYSQDRHFPGFPSESLTKTGEGEGEGGVGEGGPVRSQPPRLALVPPEPAPPPVPKGHRRPKAPLRSKEETIAAAGNALPTGESHPAWQAFAYIMHSRWTIGGQAPRPCWEIPGFDAVRIAQKLGAPQYDSVPKDEIVRACDRLEVATDTKSDLGLYLLGWFNRELKFQAERSARYGGSR
jgi:hypothetical protein